MQEESKVSNVPTTEFKSKIQQRQKEAVEDSKKNIKVIFKFRGGEQSTENLGPDVLEVRSHEKSVMFEGKTYKFSEALGPTTTQFETYQKSCKEVISKVLDGFNGTIFVYGNSGSGKTHTMLGPDSVVEYLSSPDMKNQNIDPGMAADFGIILRACTEIFELMNKSFTRGENIVYKMNAQYFEIYMEKIFDLINYTGEGANLKTTKAGETYIEPMTKCEIRTPQDVCRILEIGQKHKKQSSTHINNRSSRSHTIFLLEVLAERKDGVTKKAKLNLIDLAGSEKYNNIGDSEELHKESTHINKSLHHLSNCILALSEGHKFVSFRGSKLTHYLKDTLSGNSNTVLICTGSHQKINHNHTKMTLEFGIRAQKVKTKPVSTEEMSKAKMMKQIRELKQENFELKIIIEEIRNGADPKIIETLEKYKDEKSESAEEVESQDEEEETTEPSSSRFDYVPSDDVPYSPAEMGERSQSMKVEDKNLFTKDLELDEKLQSLLSQNNELHERLKKLGGKEKFSNKISI